jgi:hypothetical protein
MNLLHLNYTKYKENVSTKYMENLFVWRVTNCETD